MGHAFAGRFFEAFLDSNARLVKSTQYRVYTDATALTAATLYTDRTKATFATQPLSTDANGMAEVFADPGTYWVQVGSHAPVRIDVLEDIADTLDADTEALDGEPGSPALPGVTVTDPVIVEGVAEFSVDSEWGYNDEIGAYLADPGTVPAEDLAWVNPFTLQVHRPGEEPEDAGGVAQALADHEAKTTHVHGFENTEGVESQVGAEAKVSAHNLDPDAHGLPVGEVVLTGDDRLTNARPPTGGAGGVLSGEYPNPGFANNMATQQELDDHNAATTAHGYDLTTFASFAYVDAAASRAYAPVRVATTANVNLTTGGLLTIDGVTVSANDRVLVKSQTTASQNGIYDAKTTTWTRSSDLDGSSELVAGSTVYVQEGTASAGKEYRLTFSGTANLGTTPQTWYQPTGLSAPTDGPAETPSLRTLGTGAQQAAAGNDARLTNTREPTAGSVENPHVADDAEIEQSKIKDLPRSLEDAEVVPNGVWRPLYEPGVGGRVTGLAVSPHDPNHLVSGGDMLGVCVSFDRGETWTRSLGLGGHETGSVTFDPFRPGRVWVGTMSGPQVSENGGLTFEPRVTGLPTSGQEYYRPVEVVVPHPTNRLILYAFGGSKRVWKDPPDEVTGYGNVYKSVDAGETWTTVGSLGTDFNAYTAAISANGATLLAGGPGDLRRSTDGGVTWLTTGITGLPGTVRVWSIEAHATDANTFWLSTSGVTTDSTLPGIYRSTDAGLSWTARMNGLPTVAATPSHVYRVLRLARNGTTLWASLPWVSGGSTGMDAVYKTVDAGANWTVGMDNDMKPAGAWPPGVGTQDAIAIDPSDANHVLIGSSNAIFQTDTGGGSAGAWRGSDLKVLPDDRVRGRGYSGLVAEHAAYDPSKKGRLFLTNFDAGNVLRSVDGYGFDSPSRSWEPYGGAYWISHGGVHGERMYVVLGQSGRFKGLGYSADHGATWTFVEGAGVGLPAKSDTSIGGRFSVAPLSIDGTVALASIGRKLYLTTDGGATWTITGDQTQGFEQLVTDNRTLTADGVGTTVYIADPVDGVYVTTDRGATTSLVSGTPKAATSSGASSLSFCQVSGRLYVSIWQSSSSVSATNQGLWRYDGTWSRLRVEQHARYAAADPSEPTRILLATNDGASRDTSRATGVWLSNDDGATWTNETTNLTFPRVRTLAWDPFEPGRAIIGTDGAGWFTASFNPHGTAKFSGTIEQSQVNGLTAALDGTATLADTDIGQPRPALPHAAVHRFGGDSELPELWGEVGLKKTVSYAPVREDMGKTVWNDSASAVVYTLDANEFPINTRLRFARMGTGGVSVEGATGVQVNGATPGTKTLSAQWTKCEAYQYDLNKWIVRGDVA